MTHSRTLPRIALWFGLFVVIALGWHYMCNGRMEAKLNLWASDYTQKNPGAAVDIEMHPFSNLVEVHLTMKSDDFAGSLAQGILVLAGGRIENVWERELKAKARENVDVYAMLIPYQVALRMD